MKRITNQSKEVKSGTETNKSTLSFQHRREIQPNTIKQPQKEQMASRVGKPFEKNKLSTLLAKLN